MWSKQGHSNYSRDSPIDSSLSSYSSSAIQQMLKINIDRPKQSNTTGFTARSTKYNSSYHKLKETRASDILQTLQKFDKKYVNFNKAEEHDDSSISSLGKLSVENLPFTTKTVANSDIDIFEKKPILYSVANFENQPTILDFGDSEKNKSKITGKIQTNVSVDLMKTNNSTSKVHLSDYSHVSIPKQKLQSKEIQDSKSEMSAEEEISNESVTTKPRLKVTVQAKNLNKRQLENNSILSASESRIKTPDTEFAEKALYSHNEQKHNQHEQLDYLNTLKMKSGYNENKVNSSSTSTIHTEPSASIRSSANTQEREPLGASSQKTQQNELKMFPFKVLTLDDLMDESQLSSKSQHNYPTRDFQEVNGNVKQKFTVKDTYSNLVSAKPSGHQQETDEEIDEILEDSEPQNTNSMDSTTNKSEKSHSSVISAKNLQLESSRDVSDSSKRSVLSENSEELVSVKQSLSNAAKIETKTSSKNSVASNSSSQEESVKVLKPQESELPKIFHNVSSQTDANHHQSINQGSTSTRLLPNKTLHFSQGTQTNINSQSLLPDTQQAMHQHENESKLEQISTNIMLNEVLKQQIKLTKHFIENQQRIHSVYLTTVNQLSANFKPVTLEDTEQYIKANLQSRPL